MFGPAGPWLSRRVREGLSYECLAKASERSTADARPAGSRCPLTAKHAREQCSGTIGMVVRSPFDRIMTGAVSTKKTAVAGRDGKFGRGAIIWLQVSG